jgi:hypothetical protein
MHCEILPEWGGGGGGLKEDATQIFIGCYKV